MKSIQTVSLIRRKQLRSATRAALSCESLETRHLLDSTVVINELMYHPPGAEMTEFLELYNQMAVDMDLSGWQLTDGVDFTFPKGTVIPGDGYLVVARDPASLLAATGTKSFGPYEGRLSNGGERVELSDQNGRVMNVVDYDDENLWPLAPDGTGVSLAKRTLNSGSEAAANWTSSVVIGGTPGRANFGQSFKPDPQPVARTLIDADDAWRYDDRDVDLPDDWTSGSFDDSAWPGSEQPAIFYAGDAQLADAVAQPLTGVMASASSALTGHAPENLVDGSGIVNGAHVFQPAAGTMWLSNGTFFGLTPDTEPQVTFDLGQVQPLNGIKIWNFNHVDDGACCLDRGISLVDIYVAGEDGQFELWRNDQPLDRAPGTETDFSQLIQLGDLEARYVQLRVDTTNGVANHGAAFDFAGLSEVQFLVLPAPGETELIVGPTTHYFRKKFTFNDAPDRTTLTADLLIDDGAVVYLNGQEVYRHNLLPGPIDHETLATIAIGDSVWVRDLQLPADALRAGENVLAVEAHQAGVDDADMTFALELRSVTEPPRNERIVWSPLIINELHPDGSTQLLLELHNPSSAPISLTQVELQLSNGQGITLPNEANIGPNGYYVATLEQNATPYTVGDKIALVDTASNHILDAIEITNNNQSRLDQGSLLWYRGSASLGRPNDISMRDEVVINEIMYHHRPVNVDDQGQEVPYREVEQEWIELLNRGDATVDLTGWSFAGGIDFEFPKDTQLDPGQFLVVANDAESLRITYPDIAASIVGDFSGGLNNQTDHIQLLDASDNLADEVRYFENGQWPAGADGDGSSLELKDPRADNSIGAAWAASDESGRSAWHTYRYRGLAGRSAVGPDNVWNELVVGLLDDGEILLDDISVIEDPDGTRRELIQNGSFQSDSQNASATKWRIIGNHRHSEVIVDPDNPDNRVLRFVATGPTEHMHNHAETTLKFNDEFVTIDRRAEYEISFKAKWITGSNLLNTRLYFNRLPKTTRIAQPTLSGTPGAPNSMAIENLGPTYWAVQHHPAVPKPGEATRVTAQAADPDGVAAMTLWYSVDTGTWQSIPMQASDSLTHQFEASIPGQDTGAIVQFYVEGEDGQSARTTFPQAGRQSRALYQVGDNEADQNGLHNFRIIMTEPDAALLHDTVELMSNDRIGATIVYDETEIFYDAGVRLSGSQRARPFRPRLSFSVGFPSDQLFRGVHSRITLDRSESTGFGQRELIYHHGMSHAGGGLPSEYNDLFHIITPRSVHTGPAEAQLARYSDTFLDEQYENGSEGQLYEYELIYYPTTTDDGTPEGRKRPSPDSVVGTPIRGLGDNPDDYRWTYLNKNNRQEDNYDRLMQFATAMGQRSSQFLEEIDQFVDTDQWLRAFAFSTITGHGDNYGADGAQHNAQFYVRPSDNKVLFLPHDLDAFFQVSRPIVGSGDLRKFLRDPENEHMYYGHVLDQLSTTFNADYMTYWANHFGELLPRQPFDRHLRDLQRRTDYLLNQISRNVPEVELTVEESSISAPAAVATISGTAWIDVRQLQVQGSNEPLDVEWVTPTEWTVRVPVVPGTNDVTLEAFDFQGQLVGRMPVTIESRFGDLNDDRRVNAADIDLLCREIRTGGDRFDLDGNGETNLSDHEMLVTALLSTGYGDANLDGVFDSQDLVITFQAGAYEQVNEEALWSSGDWNCDGVFTSADLVKAMSTNVYQAGEQARSVFASKQPSWMADLLLWADDELERLAKDILRRPLRS